MSIRILLAGLAALGLSACAAVDLPDTPSATRNVPLDLPTLAPGSVQVQRSYALADVQVLVPGQLRVSESNSYYPNTDIVWRGDRPGDRHAQVGALFTEAATRAGSDLTGDRAVVAQIQLIRFHGVTERTRFSVGGVYNMVFLLQVVDARTGAVVEPFRQVTANLPAPGGQAALALEAAGQTEKVRVVDYLSFVLERELSPVTPPGGPSV